MPLIVEKWLTLETVRANPDKVYLFGDNVWRRGKKGQAIIRDEPNALGIRTKWEPRENPESYFSDSQYAEICALLDEDLNVVDELLRAGLTVVMPEAGLGTGLAQFDIRAPRAFNYLIDRLLKATQIEPTTKTE